MASGSSPSSNGFGSIGRDPSTLGSKSLASGGVGGLSAGHSSGGNLLSDPWASPGASQQGPGQRPSLSSMNGHQQNYQRSPILSGMPGTYDEQPSLTLLNDIATTFDQYLTHPPSQCSLLRPLSHWREYWPPQRRWYVFQRFVLVHESAEFEPFVVVAQWGHCVVPY